MKPYNLNQKSKICITLAGKTESELLKILAKTQKLHNFVELRLDFLEKIDSKFLAQLKESVEGRAIVTCRAKQDGGKFTGNDQEQLEILQAANDVGFDFVDVDLRLVDKLQLKEKKSQIIVSYHHFSHTPGYLSLKKILKKMQASRADIYKFACHVNSQKDLHSLYKLLINKKPTEEMIVLGMGKNGQQSRLLSPLLGGFLTFASLDESVAPGQLGFEKMTQFYSRLT